MATLGAGPTKNHPTEQFRGILTDQFLPQEGGMDGKKPKHKMACKQQAILTTLCKELQASNYVYKSQGAPVRGIGPPPV